MSIGYFPDIYPDELIYSVLARFYVHSGYSFYICAAEDIYVDKKITPDMLFLNKLNREVLEHLIGNDSMESFIYEHTLFPVYANFLHKDRREKALLSLIEMEGNYYNLLPIQKTGVDNYLRYCPCCVKEDRAKYGETYWHRKHQISDVRYCYKHGCILKDSKVLIGRKSSLGLLAAEIEIEDTELEYNENQKEVQVAVYISEIMDMKCKSEIPVHEYLKSRLEGTKYLSVRGEQRNISLLFDDMKNYYQEMTQVGIQELWQLQKVFTGDRTRPIDIVQIALFLGITPSELMERRLPLKSQMELFDEKVKKMHEMGISYPKIALQLGVPLETVKKIGRTKKAIARDYINKCGAKAYDWKLLDRETLPKVKEVAKYIYGTGADRPHMVTKFAVSKALGLPDKRIDRLPLCMKEISKYQETQVHYWCRELEWAVSVIEQENHELSWKQIRIHTNMRNVDFKACEPYFKDYKSQQLRNQLYEIYEKICC